MAAAHFEAMLQGGATKPHTAQEVKGAPSAENHSPRKRPQVLKPSQPSKLLMMR